VERDEYPELMELFTVGNGPILMAVVRQQLSPIEGQSRAAQPGLLLSWPFSPSALIKEWERC
jgi:hypothetical protein